MGLALNLVANSALTSKYSLWFSRSGDMWGAKKQNHALGFKTPVGVVNDALASGQANFIKILSAVNAGCIAITFDLEDIEAF